MQTPSVFFNLVLEGGRRGKTTISLGNEESFIVERGEDDNILKELGISLRRWEGQGATCRTAYYVDIFVKNVQMGIRYYLWE